MNTFQALSPRQLSEARAVIVALLWNSPGPEATAALRTVRGLLDGALSGRRWAHATHDGVAHLGTRDACEECRGLRTFRVAGEPPYSTVVMTYTELAAVNDPETMAEIAAIVVGESTILGQCDPIERLS
jgi:hypothetical protein